MYCFRRAGFCIVLLVSFSMVSGQAHADLLYTITGFANTFGDPDELAPEVAPGESYVAEFFVDESTPDSDASDGRGSYLGAITSSSITFSGGYTSMVDFAGGEVIIQQDIGGGAIGLFDLAGNGSILIGDLGNPFPSDDLLDAGTQIIATSPLSLWILTEPTGSIVSFSEGLGPSGGGPITLTVTNAVPEPSTAGLLALGACGFLTRRRS